MKRIFLLLAILPISSCSLIFEAADISIRRSKEVTTADQLAGGGFTVRPPETGLYPTYNHPLKGGITLRPTDTFRDGLAYIVTPFPSATARTTDQALAEWNAIGAKRGFQLQVMEKGKSSFAGLPATRALVRATKGRGYRQIGAMLLVKRDSDFLVLCQGDRYGTFMGDEPRVIANCKEGLDKLIKGTRLTDVR